MPFRMIQLPDGSWIDHNTVVAIIPRDKGMGEPVRTYPHVFIGSKGKDWDYECKSLEEAKQIAADLARAINSAP